MSTPKRISPRLEKLRAKTKVENPDKATTSATKTNKRKALGPPSTGEIIGRTKGLSAYEIKRLENIARNKQVLANLGLSGAKRELSQAITTKKPRIATLGVQRVKRAARKRKPKLPPRRSLRVQGKDADGKELPPNFKEPNKHGGGGYETKKEEKLSIQGNVEVDEDGKTFLQSLRMASSASDKGKRRSSRVKQEMGSDYHSRKGNEDSDASDDEMSLAVNGDLIDYAERLADLSVDPINGVRRLTKDRIYCLDVSPSSSQICVAAGDKFGRFGLWAVGSNAGQAGVFSARPHNATCIDVKFNPVDPSKIYTSSYDGRIMVLDANQTKFNEMYHGDISFYEMELKNDMSTMFAAREDGGVTQFDLRSNSKVVNEWDQ